MNKLIIFVTLALVCASSCKLTRAQDGVIDRIQGAASSLRRSLSSISMDDIRERMPSMRSPSMPRLPSMPGMPGMPDMPSMRGLPKRMRDEISEDMSSIMDNLRSRTPNTDSLRRRIQSLQQTMASMTPEMRTPHVREDINDMMEYLREMIARAALPDLPDIPEMPGMPGMPRPRVPRPPRPDHLI